MSISIAFVLSKEPIAHNQIKLLRFLFTDANYADLSFEAKALYSVLVQHKEPAEPVVAFNINDLKSMLRLSQKAIEAAKKALIQYNLINDPSSDDNVVEICNVERTSIGYYNVPEYIRHSLFQELTWGEITTYAIYRNLYIYAYHKNLESGKYLNEQGTPFALFQEDQMVQLLNISKSELKHFNDQLTRYRLITYYGKGKGYYRVYVMEPIGLKPNTIALEETQKNKLTVDLPPLLAAVLKNRTLKDTEFLIHAINKQIDDYNNLYTEQGRQIDLNKNEQSYISLVKSISFILSEKHIDLLDYKEAMEMYIGSFCDKLGETMDKHKDKNIQLIIKDKKALEIFERAEDDVLSIHKSTIELKFISKARHKPGESPERHQINKEIVINGVGLMHDNIMPDEITQFFLQLNDEYFEKTIIALKKALLQYRSIHARGIKSFIFDFNSIKNRLLHGLYLYILVGLEQKTDIDIPKYQYSLLIFHEIEKSYAENHKPKKLTLDDTTLYEAAKAVKEAPFY